MRRQEIISAIENNISSTQNEIAQIRNEMPKPTLSMKGKRVEQINEAWTKIEMLSKQLEKLESDFARERAKSEIEKPSIVVWQTSKDKWQCQSADSYKRYSFKAVNGFIICNCPDSELRARFIAEVSSKSTMTEIIEPPPAVRKPTILPGQRFYAKSKKAPAIWEVFERIKSETQNIIRCRVIDGAPQEREYIGPQFGYLLRQGIIQLIPDEPAQA
ncbi:MAG: hypothetical protein HZC28_08550 [Spirochaetes bacterium]|nr:hypothetical protein [Spirochaetota bacterium]